MFENQRLTYGELNSRANQLAHHLQTLGVGSDTSVAICADRSLEMIIAILGVLKAGGAYVPLDPALPKERLAFMLADTQAPVLLTQQSLLESLPEHKAQVVTLEAESDTLHSGDACISGINPENLAYVIYTSGSTGKPKGVAIEHQQLLNYVNGILEKLNLQNSASYAMVSTFGADLGHTMLFSALCSGGTLHIISQERAANPEALAEYFRRHPIDCLKITPPHLSALMAASNPADVLPRQKLVLGGDAASWELIEQIRPLAPQCAILNHYGPTETTVGVLTYQVDQTSLASQSATLPLGRPLPNSQIYILDHQLNPVPTGVGGELHIGGAGLARGYLNQPDLTAEKFIPNPFFIGNREQGTGDRGQGTGNREQEQVENPKSKIRNPKSNRLYKTGDLARYLPDGNIEFLGRIDHQVKIRGFRIELGEVESVLAQHPAVQKAVVIVREETPGDKRLVAYVVPNSEQAPIADELRGFLKQQLPDYMAQGSFVLLDALPLTPNGKVDRQALPTSTPNQPRVEASFVAPRDEVERQLAKIWETLFGIESVGLRDDFFELGGHSLLAVRLFAAIEKAFNQRLPLAKLFEGPTIEHLANVLRQDRPQSECSSLVAIQPLGDKPPFFFIHSGFGEVLLYQNLAFRLDLDRPVYGLQALGADGKTAPLTQIEEMATHYIREIQTVQPQGPYFLGGVCVGGIIALEMACQLQAQGENVRLVTVFGAVPLHVQRELSFTFRPPSGPKLSEKLSRYLDFISKLNPQEKVVYFLDAVYIRVQSWLDRLQSDQFSLAQGEERPLSLDRPRHDVFQTIRKAQRHFEQKVFNGQLIAFWARKDPRFSAAQQLRWADLVTGGVEIYDAPEAHIVHSLKGPSAQSIAETLRHHINAAEAKTSDTRPTELTKIKTAARTQAQPSPQGQVSKSWSSLITIKPDGSNPPLFCIHGSDGSNPGEPLYAYDLARHIKSSQPIYGLRALGLDGQQHPLETVEQMAAHYLDEIRALFPSGPYLFLGLDMGGLIAFEMAQQLSHQRQRTPLLVLFNTSAPACNPTLANHFDSSGKFSTNNKQPLLQPKFQQRSLKEKFNAVKLAFEKNRKGMKCKFFETVIQEPLPDDLRYFQIQQSLIRAQSSYKAKSYAHELKLFRFSETTTDSQPDLGWEPLSRGELEIYNLPGNRTNVFKTPNIQHFSQQLEDCINKSLTENEPCPS